jgi:hypothetical protein
MTINQYLSDDQSPQVYYQNRWVNRENFRAYVYSGDAKKIANSYKEYSELIESGLWFSTRDNLETKGSVKTVSIKSAKSAKLARKAKNGTNC